LLLHVVDVASPTRRDQIEQVNLVLKEIGADDIPQLMVLNKIDLTGLNPGMERDEYGKIQRVLVSARTGAGMDLLRQAVTEYVLSEKRLRSQPEMTDAEEPAEAKIQSI
jgi:GTP-binding protein HflX